MIDRHLTRFITTHHLADSAERPDLSGILAELCHALDSGSSCLPLEQSAIPIHEALTHLAVDAPGSTVGSPGSYQPLILTPQHKLYLNRYFAYEQEIASQIQQRLQHTSAPPADLEQQLLSHFGDLDGNDQAEAARKALRRRFSILSGGPGTGKTTTVVKVLRLLHHYGHFTRPEEVLLLAPTGKAADRLQQSIRGSLTPTETDTIPTTTSTIQRALGFRPRSVNFTHDADTPLYAQVVIVDESSMIALPLMAKLLRAIPQDATIILLGDQHQLSSVEVGSVLGDLITHATPQNRALHDAVTILRKTYRNAGGIHSCCQAIKANAPAQVLSHIAASQHGTNGHVEQSAPPTDPSDLTTALAPYISQHWLPTLQDSTLSVSDRLAAIDRFRLLTPTTVGPYGTDALNQHVESTLRRAGIPTTDQWYEGRAIIIQHNDHQLRIFNGDTGLCVRDADGQLKVAFATPTGPRLLAPTILPAVKTAWALTIHRTQGSEYDHILLLLPSFQTSLATRELLYTGLSRAKTQATLWATPETITTTIQTQAQRASGLQDLL